MRPLRDYPNFADRRSRSLVRSAVDRLAPAGLRPTPLRVRLTTDELRPQVMATRSRIERLLTENLVPFWHPACVEPAGGFRFDRDQHGFVAPRAHRTIPVARTTWFFAALARSPWGADAHLDAARHGLATMRDVLWDQAHGGFVYEARSDGRITMATKSAYAHAFALSAATEVAEATGDPDVAQFAHDIFAVGEDHFHDRAHGGYRELTAGDWSDLADPVPSITWAHPRHRTLNGLVHLTEAICAYAGWARAPRARRRLDELARLLAETTLERGHAAGIDTFTPDWTPIRDHVWPRIAVSYGHEAERVAVMGRAADVLGLAPAPVHARMTAVVEEQLRHGWDRWRGGVFLSGALGGPAWDPTKVWWVQAESLASYLDLYARTGHPPSGAAYLEMLRWIERHQVDWAGGEWFARIERFGRPREPKTSVWKTPFHIGRSLLLVLRSIDALAEAAHGAARPGETGAMTARSPDRPRR